MVEQVLWEIFEIVINLYESFIAMHFICSSLTFKRTVRWRKFVFLSGCSVYAAIISAFNLYSTYEGELGIIYSLWFFIYSLCLLNGTVLKKLFVSVFTNVILIGASGGIASIMSLLTKDSLDNIYSQQTINRLLTILIGQTILTYVFAVIRQIMINKIGFMKPKEWLLIVSIFFISFTAFSAIHISAIKLQTSDGNITLLIAAEFCIILINIVCWYITVNISKMRNHEEELSILTKQNEYNVQYSEIMKSQYEQTHRLRHDMKQYFVVLAKLLDNEKYDEAKKLIAQNCDGISATNVVVDVGNDFVNAILSVKLSEAKSLGISVICSVERGIGGIESTDLCSLIGNLLDNAIEAAKQCSLESRSLEFSMLMSKAHINITVRNSITSSVLTKNSKLVTNKKNISEHGYGIKTIKSIAEKYDGEADFYEENNTFISCVTLYKQ